MTRRVRGAVSCAALTCLLLVQSGCFGNFKVTRAVWEFNRGVSGNRVVQSLVMWAMVLIPVYAVAGLADILIFNVVEAFQGQPVASAETAPDGSTTEVARVSADVVRIRHRAADGSTHEVEIVRTGERSAILRDTAGRELARAEALPDGSVRTQARR